MIESQRGSARLKDLLTRYKEDEIDLKKRSQLGAEENVIVESDDEEDWENWQFYERNY